MPTKRQTSRPDRVSHFSGVHVGSYAATGLSARVPRLLLTVSMTIRSQDTATDSIASFPASPHNHDGGVGPGWTSRCGAAWDFEARVSRGLALCPSSRACQWQRQLGLAYNFPAYAPDIQHNAPFHAGDFCLQRVLSRPFLRKLKAIHRRQLFNQTNQSPSEAVL